MAGGNSRHDDDLAHDVSGNSSGTDEEAHEDDVSDADEGENSDDGQLPRPDAWVAAASQMGALGALPERDSRSGVVTILVVIVLFFRV